MDDNLDTLDAILFAINILDPDTTQDALNCENSIHDKFAAVESACRTAVVVLRYVYSELCDIDEDIIS